ncbi:MAG: PhoH-like ATPase [Desulfovibrionales bacterium]|jgi:PhoH-like ATPase|nr:PhoH-like ATPase [Desulfovibrionales bacterium]
MAEKTYVLDTNVLIENPKCIVQFRNGEQNRIVIPYAVILELDKLKKDQRLGYVVNQAIAVIQSDQLLSILPPYPISEEALKKNCDGLILEEIKNSHLDDPIFVTNDRILQIKAQLYSIRCEGYRDANPFKSESERFTGFVEPGDNPIPNSFRWESGHPYFLGFNEEKSIDYSHKVWGVKPRSVYQNLAMELMLNQDIDLVSIQSEAGFGKTYLALACALYLVLEAKNNPFNKIFVVKPVVEIGAKMGFLPGDIEEKMAPYIRYIRDLVVKLHEGRQANRIFLDAEAQYVRFNPNKFEILPIAYVRGMNIENAVVIIDEMQNLSRTETRALLTRMCEGVKCFCLGDSRQVDNPYLNETNNGLNWVVKKFLGMRNYAHIVLKGERSRGPITDMVLRSGL